MTREEEDLKTKSEWYEIGKTDARREFESRTCENCKHVVKSEKKYSATYHCGDALKYRQVDKDFGCNKWESK